MIKKLKLKNFQSHKDTEIEFHKGINIITGSSHSGKTAIVRALNGIINNDLKGDYYVSYGEKNLEIEIETDNNIIKRVKGKDNSYFLNNEEYKAFNSNVPEQIQSVLNFNFTNIQNQFDSLFLIADTSGEATKKINTFINLEVIPNSIASITKEINTNKSKYKFLEEDLQSYKTKLEQYNFIETAACEFENINKIQNELNSINGKIQGLNTKRELIQDVNNKLNSYSKYNKIDLTKFKNDLNSLENIKKNLITLQSLINVLNKIKDLNINKRVYSRISNIKNDLQNQININKQIKDFEKFENLRAELRNQYCKTRMVMKALKDKWDKLDVCPLCKRSMKGL